MKCIDAKLGRSLIRILAILLSVGPGLVDAAPGDITTVAGDGTALHVPSNMGGPATDTGVPDPAAIAFDSSGNYFLTAGNRVYKIDTSGIITVFAGTGALGNSGDGGPATAATMRFPQGIAVDSAGNVFISDTGSSALRRVDASTGNISTVAGDFTSGNSGDGGQAQNAKITPVGLAFDGSGNLIIACQSVVRRIEAGGNALIDPTDTIVRIAGTGTPGSGADDVDPLASAIESSTDVAVDSNGDIYFVDQLGNRVRRIDISEGKVFTVAGDGTAGFVDDVEATSGRLDNPRGVAVDVSFNVFIADTENHRIRKVSPVSGLITTVAGSGDAGFSGDGASAPLAELNRPFGLDLEATGHLFFSDRENSRARRIESIAAFVPDYQPDNSVGAKASRLKGNNKYGGAGGQTVRLTVKRGRVAKLFYRLENDGNTDDQFTARVTRGNRRNFKPRWIATGSGNVTARLKAGSYVTETLASGSSVMVKGRIRIKKPRGRSAYRFFCSSISDSSKLDSARALVKAKLPK